MAKQSVSDGFRLATDADKLRWQEILAANQAGDTAKVTSLLNTMRAEGNFSGYYDDNGTYTGFAQGANWDANGSYQPVLGGKLATTGMRTDQWITPDGATHKDFTGAGVDLSGINNYNQSASIGGDAGGYQTQYQAMLDKYNSKLPAKTNAASPTVPDETSKRLSETAYQQYLNQYTGGTTQMPSAQTAVTPVTAQTLPAFDYSATPEYQRYLRAWEGKAAPEYGGSKYDAMRDEAMEAAKTPFSWDKDTDPAYQAYAKQYAREGRRASEDTMGQYAAMTGGRPSTAAVTASQQAGNYYAGQMADKIPELYAQAYQRYLQEYQRQLGLAGEYNQYGQQDYNVFRDRLAQFNTDRNFSYGAAQDAIANRRTDYNTQYQQERDRVSDARYDREWAQQLREYADAQDWKAKDWEQYLREYGDKLSQYDQAWAYQQEQDALDRERQAMVDSWSAQDQAWQDAQRRAQYGDYSGLRAMGIDVDAWLASQQPTGGYGPGSEPPATELFSTPQGETINPGSPDYLSVLNNSIRDSYNPELTKSILASRGVPAEDILYSKQMQIEDTNKGGGAAGEAGEPTVSNRSGDNWVTVEGLTGRYSWQELLLMVEDGRVDEIYDKEKNTLTYRKAR